MAVNRTDFYNWQQATKADALRFRKASPNLLAIKDYVMKFWGGTNLGLFGRRTIRDGEAMSSHSYGAAWDWRYSTRNDAKAAIRFLVKNSEELGIQAIHDYFGGTIWRSARQAPDEGGWKSQPDNPKNGMGQAWAKWLHIETTKSSWGNKKRVEDRF